MENEESYLGSFRFTGKLVEDGLLDARKAAEALIGLDEALRYFVGVQAPDFKTVDFEIPVRIKKGSWEALIPETVGQWMQAGLGVVATAYFTKAAQKMAEKDFSDMGLKEVFVKSIIGIQWLIKIGKHLGNLDQRKFDGLKFRKNNEEIGIPNNENKYLYVPKRYFDFYISCSPNILSKMVNVVEDQRILKVGVYKDGELQEEIVTKKHKNVFTRVIDENEDILFPELVHGDEVVLEGEVTRGNETANSMGFRHLGHILTIYPNAGSIVRFKPTLFLECRIIGVIDRIDEKGKINAKRPKIIFSHIEPLEADSPKQGEIDYDA